MPVELWGADGSYGIEFTGRLFESVLLLLYSIGFLALVLIYRSDFRRTNRRQLFLAAAFSSAAFFTSQIAPFSSSFNTLPGQTAANFTLLAAIPVLLAAAFLPNSLVLFVGAAAGLGHAWGETHHLFSVFNYAFTAVFAGALLKQNYTGRSYRWLRQPLLVGVLSGLLLSVLTGLGALAAGPAPGLMALDRALVIFSASLIPRIVEGLIGGLVVMVVIKAEPSWGPAQSLVPSPLQRSLQKRLVANYWGFAGALIILTLFVIYGVTVTTSTQTVLNQIGQEAAMVAGQMDEIVAANGGLPVSEIDEELLKSLALNKKKDEWMRIVSDDGDTILYYPSGDGEMIATAERWSPEAEGLQPLRFAHPDRGTAYLGWEGEDLTRELVFVLRSEEQPGLVVKAVSYTAVLQQTGTIAWQLLLVMVVAAALFYVNVLLVGRGITGPINEMVEASKTLAAGGDWKPTQYINRDDELGKLQRSFAEMQRSMRKRLNELFLLLGVSHDVASRIDIDNGLPAILKGAVRGTRAVGARAIVPNPAGGNPLSFGQGPAEKKMASLDRLIMTKLRYASEVLLNSPADIHQALGLPSDHELPVPALLVIPLYSRERLQGILWLGFPKDHTIELTERNLLSTLSTQAAVLVENARLFSIAESGRRRLAAVLASTFDAVIVTDQTERIVLINRAAENIFNLDADQVRNRPVAAVIDSEPLVQTLVGQDERPQHLEITVTDDATYSVIASTIFSNEGQVFGRVAVLRDITYLKEIDQMKSDFVATISHDLRSPLTFMRGYATMLPMVGDMNLKQSEYIEKILGGIDQMSQLVDDLLDLGRIEAGVDMEMEPIPVQPLLDDIASDYWQHAYMAGIKLEVDVMPQAAEVNGDTILIRRAITNLVSNGIKYAPNSGTIVLGANQINGEMILSVKDNGPGITKEDQVQLFDKFYRVKERGTEKVKGSGLGLAIVKTIAEKHGGRTWVQSQRGKGSTFYLSLPAPLDSEPTANGQSE